MAEIKLTMDNFDSEVIKSDIPVVVDFWADWCPPCKMVAPIVSEISEEYAGKIKVGKVNVDDEVELAQLYHIASIPTLLVFRNGSIANRAVGFMPKAELIKLLGI